ncbi:MAG: hypothetical protein AAFO07_09170 [Bacteroidota bacterium]
MKVKLIAVLGELISHAALPLVRKLYPDLKIDVINDSGQGIGDPGGFEALITYWNALTFFPSSCTDCIGSDGNLTGLHKYQLTEDNNIRLAYITATQDATAAAGLSGGGSSLEAQLFEAAGELNTAFPERFQSLIANGDEHTFIQRRFDFEIGSTTVRQWVTNMVTGNTQWVSDKD